MILVGYLISRQLIKLGLVPEGTMNSVASH